MKKIFLLLIGFFGACSNSLLFGKKKQVVYQKNDVVDQYQKNKINKIIIVAPIFVTGGVEALCQLCVELNGCGFPAKILWIHDPAELKRQFVDNFSILAGQSFDYAPVAYKKKYSIDYVKEKTVLNSSTLVIVPEIWVPLLPLFGVAKKGIYWLSIDNFLSRYRHQHELIQKIVTCVNFSDAPWISKQILQWGIKSFLVEAPISLEYFKNISQEIRMNNQIVYNPIKGAALSQLFMSNYLNYEYVPLQNLDQKGVIAALDHAKIYIDFGHFPGKDRIPREALMRGCIIFIHNVGCATDYESFPIDNFFRFSTEDVSNGVLRDKIDYALAHYEELYAQQNVARDIIKNEYRNFQQQITKVFGSV